MKLIDEKKTVIKNTEFKKVSVNNFKEYFEKQTVATNINKDYLQKVCIDCRIDFNVIRNSITTFIDELNKGVNINNKIVDKFKNFITLMYIKSNMQLFNDNFMNKLHDLIIIKPDTPNLILQKFNSLSKVKDFEGYINEQLMKETTGYTGLSSEDLKIWERVKIYKDFGEFRWVYAVDEKGKIVSYLPSRITAKTMNHCGNEPSKQPGDEYWELRDSNNKAYLTVILNNGLIQEAKSYGNQNSKYTSVIIKYVEWFYKSEKVKGVGYRYDNGYATDKNFSVSTITVYDPSFMKWCEENKPKLRGNNEKLIIKYSKMDPKKLTAD